MSSYITREQLLAYMADTVGGEGSLALVETTLVRLGWSEKQQFTQVDVIDVMSTATNIGKETIAASQDPALQQEKGHVVAMLDALEKHAYPVLRAHA